MTRITDLGRKRKYKEAQFNTLFEGEDRQAVGSNERSKAEPERKKRKLDPEIVSEQPNEDGLKQQKKGWGRSETIKNNAAKSEFRRQQRIQDRMSETVCFACRQKGHAARDCPSNRASIKMSTGICYRCGSKTHSLSKCRKHADPDNPLPFASCFVCHEKGHLASKCPKNSKGVYPNGGSCKLCGQTAHLAKDCPLRVKAPPAEAFIFNTTSSEKAPGADEDDFMVFKRQTNELNKQEQKQKGTKPTPKALAKKIVTF